MSAGDIDDKLGPAGELERLIATNPELNAYMKVMDELPIKRASTPFGAGISNDGMTRYIDHDLDCIIAGIDCSIAVVTHESVEWAVRKFCGIGVDYAEDPRGHRLANRAEYDKVADLLGGDPEEAWERYDAHLDPQLKAIEKTPMTKDVPKDLAIYPYIGTKYYKLIREAQRG